MVSNYNLKPKISHKSYYFFDTQNGKRFLKSLKIKIGYKTITSIKQIYLPDFHIFTIKL